MSQLGADDAWAQLVAARAAVLATRRPDGRTDLVPFVFAVEQVEAVQAAVPGGPAELGVWAAPGRLVSAVDHKPKRHGRLQRLDNIRHAAEVTVLADHYEEDWSQLWWVRARGRAQVVEVAQDPAVWARCIDALVSKYDHYTRQRPAGPVVAIEVYEVTGWRA